MIRKLEREYLRKLYMRVTMYASEREREREREGERERKIERERETERDREREKEREIDKPILAQWLCIILSDISFNDDRNLNTRRRLCVQAKGLRYCLYKWACIVFALRQKERMSEGGERGRLLINLFIC